MQEENVPIIMENNNGNKRKIWPIICIVLAIILIAGGGYYYYTNYYNKEAPEKPAKPNLKDDFYANINSDNTISTFTDASTQVANNKFDTIYEIEDDPSFKNENYFTFFNQYENDDEREKRGIDELKPYFDEIDKADTIDKFSDIMIKVSYDLGVNSFFNFGIIQNYYDNSKKVIAVDVMTIENLAVFLVSPDAATGLDVFTEQKYSSYKTQFENARIEFFKEYGYDEEKAKNISNQITEFAKQIQSQSKSLDELKNNLVANYKNVTKSELKALMKNLPLDKFLAKYNLSNYQYFATIDEGQIKAIDNYYKEENLPLMKEILKLLILENVAPFYTTANYARILANADTAIMGQRVNYQRIVEYYEEQLKPDMMGSILNIRYDEKYFPETEKQEIANLIDKIKARYKAEITSSDWLDESTKAAAIKKLDNMKTNIGYNKKDKEDKYANLKLLSTENGGSLISNYILMKQYEAKQISKTINDKFEVEIDHFQANAYYYPYDNSINFISGFRELYRGITNKYAIYAYAGTIVGHEISHAFDSKGSPFDENGNVKDWWTENDKQEYDAKKQKIINYYSKYDMYGTKVDGELTLAENIADLAGAKTILSIMADENATNDDYKIFFESYAKLWNDTSPKQQILLQMSIDIHSPNKIRATGVISSMDKFYEVYDIKEGDKMYVAKEDRVGLW